MPTRRVLGIDLASRDWLDNGSAVIEFDDTKKVFTRVNGGAISWPRTPLTPAVLAEVIDEYSRREGICAVSLDGPQGWRHPEAPRQRRGVGRHCESACNTQGKTGEYPHTYPGNQRPWIEFCIDVFDQLTSKRGVVLANGTEWVPPEAYVVLECFPTSAWRSSGLTALPGKNSRPDLAPYISKLRSAFRLPNFTVQSHDDLQAVVAALTAVGAVGGPAIGVRQGEPSSIVLQGGKTRRVEGLIWDVRPVEGPMGPLLAVQNARREGRTQELSAQGVELKPTLRATSSPRTTVCVTRKVLDQVNRAGPTQAQIALVWTGGTTKTARKLVSLRVDDQTYSVVVGDSHAVWRTHQRGQSDEFERLFALLAESPDKRVNCEVSVIAGHHD